jgi:S-formylglutathione hydrolase FrmB
MRYNRFQNLLLFILLIGFLPLVKAAEVDTVETFSSSMNKKIKAVVVLPEGYQKNKSYPVVYLLHGYGGKYSDWIKKVPAISSLADSYSQIIVCPDGNISSWYFDSPVNQDWKYETYITKELVQWVDENYATIKNRAGRGISGLSMGGHGALYLAFKHQDVFGAAGSMSGGVDIRPFTKNWDLPQRLGPFEEKPDNWDKNTVTNMLDLLNSNSLALIIDCGTNDFFFKVNQEFHNKLLERNIPHDFISRPGKHDWQYWSNSIYFQLLFMSRYFNAPH